MHALPLIAAWLVIGTILGLTLVLMWRIKGTSPRFSVALAAFLALAVLWPLIAAVVTFFTLVFWDLILYDAPSDGDPSATH